MPEPESGSEQVALFKASAICHLDSVKGLGDLKGTRTKKRPLFGSFDDQKSNCMFAFHLKIHLKEAARIRKAAMTEVD